MPSPYEIHTWYTQLMKWPHKRSPHQARQRISPCYFDHPGLIRPLLLMSKRWEKRIFTGVYFLARTFVAENPVGARDGGRLSFSCVGCVSLIIGWRSIFRAVFPIGIIKGARVADFCCTPSVFSELRLVIWYFSRVILLRDHLLGITLMAAAGNYGAIFSFFRCSISLRGAVL